MLPARRPYPDELCCSALLRCSRQFNVSFKWLGATQLGREAWRPTFLGASPLRELAQLFSLSPDDLLWRHTVFPYATAMMRPAYYENTVANAYGEAAVVGRLAATMMNVTTGVRRRRYCLQCAREEWNATFESYWHRSHNLPGVLVCLRHEVFLWESEHSIGSSGRFSRDLPLESKGRPLGRGSPSPTLISIAQISTDWLSRPPGPGNPVEPEAYRRIAIDSGWLSPGREVDIRLLRRAVTSVFSRPFLKTGGAPVSMEPGWWAAMMLRPGSNLPFTPFKHAVMQAFLDSPHSAERPPLDKVKGGPGASAAEELDRLYSREAQKELKRILGQGRLLTTEQFLRGVGCWGVYKHRMGELPKLRAVVREFRGSPATVKRLRPGKSLYRLPDRDP